MPRTTGTTAVLAERYRAALEAKGVEVEFVTTHAREDEGHTSYLRDQIARIVSRVPDAAPAIEYGFGRLGAKAIFAGHHPENVASRKVLLKLGFRYTGDEIFPETGILEPTYRLEACSVEV